MLRALTMVAAALLTPALASAAQFKGVYLETRTCQVYTGPCFANGESGLAGRDAIMAWHIDQGRQGDADLAGLNVVMVVRASHTLGHQGFDNADELRSILLVDERATAEQRSGLIEFARMHGGKAAQSIVRVDSRAIHVDLDLGTLTGDVKAGNEVKLTTRKARQGDCICSNEVAYYPPLAKVEHFVPGVTLEGEFRGKGLGTRWSTPNSRSAYMATFSYE